VLSSAIFLGIFIAGTASGQTIQTYEPPVPSAFDFASLTEPACPATNGSPLAPVTNEIHIFYYPTARPAAIKDPKSLVLHLVLGHELTPFDHQTIAFTRREAGVWMATAIYKTFDAPKYAIYWLEEPKSKKVDTNSGEYFKVPFCDLRGRLLEASVKLQAQSYTGVLEAHEIERSVNYARPIAVWCGPCRAELKELEKFQQDHPELVVLTAVDTTADSKDLRDLNSRRGARELADRADSAGADGEIWGIRVSKYFCHR
jgi:thiol-disulfide isomerase/thioredoxin